MALVHDEHKQFPCSQCKSSFNRKSNLNRHVRSCHDKIINHRCEDCGKGFYFKRDWTRHCRIHSGERPFVCNFCPKRFNQKVHLQRHINQVHSDQINESNKSIDALYVPGVNLQCTKCSITFYVQNDYINHMAVVHNDHHPYTCNQCQSSFSTKYHLKEHVRQVHERREIYQCHCGKTFNHKGNLKRHYRIHSGEKPFVCEHCSKCFNRKTTLQTHIKRIHSNHLNAQCESKQCDEVNSLENKLYSAGINLECADCQTLFYFHKDYINHMFIHHSINNPYQCQQCDRKFIGKTKLMQHIVRNHTESKAKRIHNINHRCDQCSESFESKSLLLAHLKAAHSDVLLKCSLCSGTFKTRSSLKVHVRRIHQKEINFKCTICGKGFFDKTAWRIHCRIHFGAKPFVCDDTKCGKKFKSKGELKGHIKRIHSQQIHIKQIRSNRQNTKQMHSKQQKCNLNHDAATGARKGKISEAENKNMSETDKDPNAYNAQLPIPENQCPSCTAKFDRKWKLKLHKGLCSFIQERKRNMNRDTIGCGSNERDTDSADGTVI